MRRAALIFFLGLIATLIFAGCRSRSDRSPVIATINGREIHQAEFDRFLALKVGEFTGGEMPDFLRSEMLDEYILRRLALEEAARAGLTVIDAEIEQEIQEKPQIKSTAAAADKREELANDLLIEKYYKQVLLREVRVSPEEIQKYVEENQDKLTERPGFYVREIRVSSRQEAEQLRREVVEERRDFAAVARLHSDAPNAEQGGLARYDEGQIPAALEKAVQPLRPGDVSQVVESGYGFHIFKLEKRIQPHPLEDRRSKLDERRSQLAEELVARKNQEALNEALDRLASSAAIQINEPALGFTYNGRLRHN